MEYSEYRHFIPVIERAKEAYIKSAQKINDHFEDYLEEIAHGNDPNKIMKELGNRVTEVSAKLCFLQLLIGRALLGISMTQY